MKVTHEVVLVGLRIHAKKQSLVELVEDLRGVNGQTEMPNWPMPDVFRNLIAALLLHPRFCRLGAFRSQRLHVSLERFKQSGGVGAGFLRPQPR